MPGVFVLQPIDIITVYYKKMMVY